MIYRVPLVKSALMPIHSLLGMSSKRLPSQALPNSSAFLLCLSLLYSIKKWTIMNSIEDIINNRLLDQEKGVREES